MNREIIPCAVRTHYAPKSDIIDIISTILYGPYNGSFQGCMLFDQIIGTWILCMTVLSVTDARNNYGALAPLIIGWAATAVGMSFGSGAG